MAKQKKRSRIKVASALKYDHLKNEAPYITASGQGAIAEEIIAVAKEYDVPVYKDPALAEVLSQFEAGAVIPEELYKAVAEILVFIYKLDQEQGKSKFYETLLDDL